MKAGRRRGIASALVTGGLVAALLGAGWSPASADLPERTRAAILVDQQNLRLAAYDIEQQALVAGALRTPVASSKPAVVLFLSIQALLHRARVLAPDINRPFDTRDLMGPVPYNLAHRIAHRPAHRHVTATHTLHRFRRSVPVGTAAGLGMHRMMSNARPAPFQPSDGRYVDPTLPVPLAPTVAAVAIRTALKKLGHPYVWAAAGADTFDCSGLVRWAYGRAGVRLTHYTGTQWNEGRLIAPRAVLPGDLVLVGRTLHHVGIYLAAGWMLNAPFTGHYVDVVPLPEHIAGVVRP